MYNIFIDTNIFLDFYRFNGDDNISKIVKEITKCRKYIINTEQSQDEFFRNREKTINDFVEILYKQVNPLYDNNFISTIDGYKDYETYITKANISISKMTAKCKSLINDCEKDQIYKIYLSSYSTMYARTDDIVKRAIKRKYIGNPPTSNKTTCCDEIIWESLLENCQNDLIIVSRDKTFKDNYNFLKREYEQKTNHHLVVVELISDAIRLVGEIPSESLENIESDLIVQRDFSEYGILSENSNWVNIVYNALMELGNEASLKEIYDISYKTVVEKYPEKISNKNIEATIRGILYRYSNKEVSGGNKTELFRKTARGKWAINIRN